MKKDEWNFEGQMTIFDFLKPEKDEVAAEPFETMTIEDAVEVIQNRTSLKFTKYEEHFKGHYMAKKKGYVIQIGFNNFAPSVQNGRRYLDVQIDKGTWGCGCPCTSIDKAVKQIERIINECEYSKHTCNKEELWKIAESLDDPFCPHVCCRFCATKHCGARCNGSEEPKEAKEQAIDYEVWHDIEEQPPEGAYCKFEYLWNRHGKEDAKGQCNGWWQDGKVKWLNMPWDIGKKRVTRWKFEPDSEAICNMAAECEAYQNGCNGTIEPCSFGGPYKWSAMNEPQPREVVVKGFMDDGYCPNCDGCLEDLVKECRYCGQLVSWENWKIINDYESEEK